MIKKLCLQTWSVRDHMQDAKSIKESFEKLKAMGYDQIQTADERIPYPEFAKLAKEAGIEIVGTHYSFEKMENDIEGAIEEHKLMGTTNMGVGGWGFQTEADVYDFIERANKIADRISKEGMKFTYHNHYHEFRKFGDKTIMEMLAEGLDKDKTSFVLDTYWVQYSGGDSIEWIKKLAGRIDILHLKDMMVDKDCKIVSTEIGNGNMNFKGIIKAAEETGVKYFCVEQESYDGRDSIECVKDSSEYLHKYYM